VLEPPVRFAPSPYTQAELERIRGTLPSNSVDAAATAAILAARRFLVGRHLREKENTPPKPDPHQELWQFQRALEELRAAIRALSPDAIQHLASHPSPGAGRPPLRPYDVNLLLHRFEYDNRFAFRDLPERHMIGAAEKLEEEALIYRLWTAWRFAHGMRSSTRGWPAFRSACFEPLLGVRFRKELQPSARTERGWQMLRARAVVRWEGEKK
jgi:hypothetical protein